MPRHGNTLSPKMIPVWHSAILEALPRDIDEDIARGWIDNREALTKVLRQALMPPTEYRPLFSNQRKIVIPERLHPFDPHLFYRERGTLKFSVGSEGLFKTYILPLAGIPDVLPARELTSYELETETRIRELAGALSYDRLLQPMIFCSCLAAMIESQSRGEIGYLTTKALNMFSINAVPAPLFVIAGWYGNVWEVLVKDTQDAYELPEGSRIFM